MSRHTTWISILLFAITVAPIAQAQVQESQAEATATAAGDPGGSDLDTVSGGTASAIFTSNGNDSATGEAIASVGGAVRSRAYAGGASGTVAPSDGFGRAAWYSSRRVIGVDPNVPIDIDLQLSIDGSLLYANNNGGANVDDIRSSIRMEITVYDEAYQIPFDGTVKLATDTNSTPPVLTRSGSYQAPVHDGDFTVVSCTRFSCQIDVDTTISLPDVLTVDFGEEFAVEVQFITQAHIWAGREVEAEADFLNTGNLTLSTDTPGVTIEAIPPAPPAVPTLNGPAIILVALLLCTTAALVQRRIPGR